MQNHIVDKFIKALEKFILKANPQV